MRRPTALSLLGVALGVALGGLAQACCSGHERDLTVRFPPGTYRVSELTDAELAGATLELEEGRATLRYGGEDGQAYRVRYALAEEL